MHPIDESSPLHGETPESAEQKELELQVSVVGLDDITMQPVHAQHHYFTHQILWGRRLTDILHEEPDGDLVLDLHKFQHTEPSVPTPTFPYPQAGETTRNSAGPVRFLPSRLPDGAVFLC